MNKTHAWGWRRKVQDVRLDATSAPHPDSRPETRPDATLRMCDERGMICERAPVTMQTLRVESGPMMVDRETVIKIADTLSFPVSGLHRSSVALRQRRWWRRRAGFGEAA